MIKLSKFSIQSVLGLLFLVGSARSQQCPNGTGVTTGKNCPCISVDTDCVVNDLREEFLPLYGMKCGNLNVEKDAEGNYPIVRVQYSWEICNENDFAIKLNRQSKFFDWKMGNKNESADNPRFPLGGITIASHDCLYQEVSIDLDTAPDRYNTATQLEANVLNNDGTIKAPDQNFCFAYATNTINIKHGLCNMSTKTECKVGQMECQDFIEMTAANGDCVDFDASITWEACNNENYSMKIISDSSKVKIIRHEDEQSKKDVVGQVSNLDSGKCEAFGPEVYKTNTCKGKTFFSINVQGTNSNGNFWHECQAYSFGRLHPRSTICEENPKKIFFYRMNANDLPLFRTCEWLSLRADSQSICDNLIDSWDDGAIEPAREVCKQTCRTCHLLYPSISPAPSISSLPTFISEGPSSSPSKAPSSCVEEKDDYFFYRAKKDDPNKPLFHTCEWLSERDNAQSICDNFIDSWNDGANGPAREVCKQTCGTCYLLYPSISPAPSKSSRPSTISASPSSSPSEAPSSCAQNKNELFFYRMKKDDPNIPLFHTCEWLSLRANAQSVCDDFIDSWDNGAFGPAREVCKQTCGTCHLLHPSLSPSSIPTVTRSAAPSQMPSACPENSKKIFFYRMSVIHLEVPVFHTCGWLRLRENAQGICNNFIDSWDDGETVILPAQEACLDTCGTCHLLYPSLSPAPSAGPSSSPSLSIAPSAGPSSSPSALPSYIPTKSPSSTPSFQPSVHPSTIPSSNPSETPSSSPSFQPSTAPSSSPSKTPSSTPSLQPSMVPSSSPSVMSSVTPSFKPSLSSVPSVQPILSARPTTKSSKKKSSKAPKCPKSDVLLSDLSPSNISSDPSPSSMPSDLSPSSMPSMQPSESYYPSQLSGTRLTNAPKCVKSTKVPKGRK